jgi:hypothetical protein
MTCMSSILESLTAVLMWVDRVITTLTNAILGNMPDHLRRVNIFQKTKGGILCDSEEQDHDVMKILSIRLLGTTMII